jgi:hypothetical protein
MKTMVHDLEGRLPAPGRQARDRRRIQRRGRRSEAAAAFPYQQAYLPYNRLVDGTVQDW